jgi:hypothetical protein
MKILSVGTELLHKDRRTADMTKLIVAFRSFANVPQKDHLQFEIVWAEAAQIAVFWDGVVIILGWCYDYSGIILLFFWDGVIIILELCCDYSGIML